MSNRQDRRQTDVRAMADLIALRGENASLRQEGCRLRQYAQRIAAAHDPGGQLLVELETTHKQMASRISQHTAELQQANEQLQAELAERNDAHEQVDRLNQEVEDTQREIILKLAEIVEHRSKETGSHVMRVAKLSHLLASKCGLNPRQIELVGLAAPMHDVGKVGIPDAILLNPGRLSAEDFEIMKGHTTLGYQMLKGSSREVLQTAALIALHHHEKFNGTGYPQGLAGEEITLYGRITALADVYDALGSDRVYRKAWDTDRILDFFRRQRGESFDPFMVDLLFANLAEFQAIKDSFPTDFQGDDGDESGEQTSGSLGMLFDAAATQKPGGAISHGPRVSSRPTWRNAATGLGPRDRSPDSREVEHVHQVLVADNNAETLQWVESALSRWGYDVRSASCGSEAREVLEGAQPPKLVILSYDMSDTEGVKLCREIRNSQSDYVYIILLVSSDCKREVSLGLAAGADACITRPIDEDELHARLYAGERILALESELVATQETLREQATHDALSGLWNRGAILQTLLGELDRAKRDDTSVGVMMCDLDNFKNVNDTYGHRAGDLVLREISRRMRSVMRPYDMVGRYGGEEFLIIVPRCDCTFAEYVAQRVLAAVSATPVKIDGQNIFVTISIGVAAKRGVEDFDEDMLIHAADTALYKAKRNGRNRVEIAEAQAV